MNVPSLGHRIRMLRGNESMPGFAKKMYVHRNTLARYESGKGSPSADFLFQLCEFYNVNPTWLFFGEGPKERQKPPPGFSEAHNALRERIENLGAISQWVQLESMPSVSRAKLMQYLRGEYMPTDEELETICDTFGWDFEKISSR